MWYVAVTRAAAVDVQKMLGNSEEWDGGVLYGTAVLMASNSLAGCWLVCVELLLSTSLIGLAFRDSNV